jgi:hypothetical protein
MSVANCHERLGALDDAERHMRDAAAIFVRARARRVWLRTA